MKEQQNSTESKTYTVELGSRVNKTIGRNKCGMPWKKKSKQSQLGKPQISKSYERRMQER